MLSLTHKLELSPGRSRRRRRRGRGQRRRRGRAAGDGDAGDAPPAADDEEEAEGLAVAAEALARLLREFEADEVVPPWIYLSIDTIVGTVLHSFYLRLSGFLYHTF